VESVETTTRKSTEPSKLGFYILSNLSSLSRGRQRRRVELLCHLAL